MPTLSAADGYRRIAIPPLVGAQLPDAPTLRGIVADLVSFFKEYKKRTPGDPAEASTTQFLWNASVVDGPSAAAIVRDSIAAWCAERLQQSGAAAMGVDPAPSDPGGARERELLAAYCGALR